MAKTNAPAAAAPAPAATEQQQPEMREIVRQIKKVVKAITTLNDLGMKQQIPALHAEIAKLRDYATKRFQKELDAACEIPKESAE